MADRILFLKNTMMSMTTMIRTYSDLLKLKTFEDRFKYLKLSGNVGISTFGYDRYLNQQLYKSSLWKKVRDKVIIRDDGLDLACDEKPIFGRIIIHHMNPITKDDILYRPDYVLNPEYLISVSEQTHKAIHYGDFSLINSTFIERKPNDTIPWR